jgi:hypothetical protein
VLLLATTLLQVTVLRHRISFKISSRTYRLAREDRGFTFTAIRLHRQEVSDTQSKHNALRFHEIHLYIHTYLFLSDQGHVHTLVIVLNFVVSVIKMLSDI